MRPYAYRVFCHPYFFEKVYGKSMIIQPTSTWVTCIVKFNVTTICMLIFQNKWTHHIILFVCYMAAIVTLMYSKISPGFAYLRAGIWSCSCWYWGFPSHFQATSKALILSYSCLVFINANSSKSQYELKDICTILIW